MSTLTALLLGLIQGLTEFFPISSSAHMKVAKAVLGVDAGGPIFDLACHLGTVAALVFFFRKDLVSLTRKQYLLFLLALLPLVPFYFLLKPVREAASAPFLLGFFLMATALILFIGQRLRLRSSSPEKDSFWIGTMQAVALIPGISRSASTISAARVLGWPISEAVRFSFLLSIPTILGGAGLEMVKVCLSPDPHPVPFLACTLGFASSLGMGLIVLPKALRFLQKGNLRPFAWYCLFAGIGISVYFLVYG